jgi:ribonuclease P protein component
VKTRLRLKRSADVKRVRRLGKSFAHPLIVLYALPNSLEMSRFAVSAGRTVGNAVQRNRAKRIIRASLAPLVPVINPGWDILIMARMSIASATSREVSLALVSLLERANLVHEHHAD